MRDWTNWRRPQKRLMPANLAAWLTDNSSLTRLLQSHNQYDFSVQKLGHYWMRPLPDESLFLERPMTEIAYQREVQLMDGEQANVYARTVIPLSTFQAMKHSFSSLGNKPLGELLFTDPTVRRGDIQIARLQAGQWLYETALLDEDERPDELWGRRSLFYIQGKALLVNEIFLPNLLWK